MPKRRKPIKPVKKPLKANRTKKKPGRKPIKKPIAKPLIKKAPVKKVPAKKKSVKKKPDYEKALQDGRLAKIKLFANMGTRIGKGDDLKASEIKLFNTLEKEFEEELNEELPAPKKPTLLQTNLEAAEYCGFTTRMISYHVHRGNIKANKDGTFDRSELDRFLATKGKRRGKKAAGSLDDKKDKADLRYRIAKAMREEMLVSQLKGNLASWEEVESQWRERVVIVTSGLEALKDRLPGLLVGKARSTIQAILEEEIKLLREAYSSVGKYCPD